MTAPASRTGRIVGASWGLFTAVALLMLGNGLLGTLLGVRSELESFATAATGAVMATYYVGFLAGSQIAPRILAHVGHVRVFAALASLASTAALIHAVFVSPAAWVPIRLVTGFCQAGLYVVAESWLNEQATNENRGRLMSVYMVVVMGGIGLGQLLLNITAPTGFRLFVVASVLISLAVVPISLSIGTAPAFVPPKIISLRRLWAAAPLGIIGGLGAGLANGALLGMGAVYATRVGMTPGRVSLFLGTALIGSVVLQWPIGALSDRVPRRRAVLAVTLLAAAAAWIATGLESQSWQLLVVMFIFGGLSFPLYSLALSHINDVLPPGQSVSASAAFVFVTGVGAIAGPISSAWAMATIGDAGFFWTLTIAHAAIGVLAAYLIVTSDAVPTKAQRKYRPIPARASAVIARVAKARHPHRRD